MNDLLERLAAANPVPECQQPSIEAVWRKISALGVEPSSERPPRRRRRRHPGRAGHAVFALAAVAIPIIVVVAITIPLLGAHHGSSRPAVPATAHVKPGLDPAGQLLAAQQLAGRTGTIVVLDPRTGAIRVMYGNAPQGVGTRFPPGATFEIVTAAAALDTGRYSLNSRIAGPSAVTVSGVPIHNDGNQSFGPLALAQALDYSVNTIFAQVGNAVGRQAMTRYMAPFGLHPSASLDLGRLAIGQGLTVTPLQMAMLAAAVADGGELMKPHLGAIGRTAPGQVMKPSTALALARMMREVVAHGTGTAADVAGLQIAGKTGTAHVGAAGSNSTDPWFIGFAPANHPRIAIAVVLSDVKNGFGGTDAAPIAAKVMKALLADRR